MLLMLQLVVSDYTYMYIYIDKLFSRSERICKISMNDQEFIILIWCMNGI